VIFRVSRVDLDPRTDPRTAVYSCPYSQFRRPWCPAMPMVPGM